MRVIPVLLQGADMPDDEDLPDDLKPLSRRNALDIRDGRWGDDVAHLVKTLRQALDATGSEPVQPRTGPPADSPGAGRSSPSSGGGIESSRATASPSTPEGEGEGGRPKTEAGAVLMRSGVDVGDKIGSPPPVLDARGSPAVRSASTIDSGKRSPFWAIVLVIGVIIVFVAVVLYANSASSSGGRMPSPTTAPAKPTEAPKPAWTPGR